MTYYLTLSFWMHVSYLTSSPTVSPSLAAPSYLKFFTHVSSYNRPVNSRGSHVSFFELILFSVYTYSLGDLTKSHDSKMIVMLLIAKFIGFRNIFFPLQLSIWHFHFDVWWASQIKYILKQNSWSSLKLFLQMSCSSQEMTMLSISIATQGKDQGVVRSWHPLSLTLPHKLSRNINASFRIDPESNLLSSPPPLPLWQKSSIMSHLD